MSFEYSLIITLLILSVVLVFIPIIVYCWRRLFVKPYFETAKNIGINRMLLFSLCLLGSIWCLRYAVGYFGIMSAESDPDIITLSYWEEIFNSINHSFQTFSMDEDYTGYILNGKLMLREMLGEDTVWQFVYGIYASILGFIAPIVGGAIIFEILASIFPKIKLFFSYLAIWREKYYFSELNEASLALAKSVCNMSKSAVRKPVIIFTDAYVDDEDESSTELLLEAKLIGAICIRDDLAHVKKNRFGMRKFFLIDYDEAGNLQTLTNLANMHNYQFLKKAEIYLFTNDDAYVQVERRMHERLSKELGFDEADLPTFVPIHSYRNLISNLLVDIPLYEPLIGKKRSKEGSVDLTVTILGTGHIGTEMFLSTYWFGQILDCNLTINVLSNESEEEFWSKIDYVNPEIKRTTIEGDPILRINRKGDLAPVYCHANYVQCDVKSSAFIGCLNRQSEAFNLLNTDYFLVSLGSDEANISVANTVRKYIGQHHIATNSLNRTVIAYVVYDPELANTLNSAKQYRFVNDRVDVYMCAIGSLREVYSARNVFMTDQKSLAQKSYESYLSVQNRDERATVHKKRMDDDYKYWANLARGMHIKYKVFSAGLFDVSLLDVDDPKNENYINAIEAAMNRYKALMSGQIEFASECEVQAHITLLHRMAWLEHRRWNAFTRIKGFRFTDNYDAYAVPGVMGSYKQMDIKLHPCLVECDQKGIRAAMDGKGEIDKSTLFMCTDRSQFDLLDDLSYDLYQKQYNGYDFKQYDYPIFDF